MILKSPHNILILAEGQLGDLILLTPALRALKSGFVGVRLTVLILQRRGKAGPPSGEGNPVYEADPRGTAAVLLGNPAVDRVVELDRRSLKSLKGVKRFWEESGLVRWLRRQEFDAVICTFPEDRFALLAYLSGARLRAGQRRQSLRWLLNVTPDIEKQHRGVLRYYCDLAGSLGVKIQSEKTHFAVPDEARLWAEECIALQCGGKTRPVVIHPGASGEYKIWPPERFAALVDSLFQRNVPVLLCGEQSDREVIGQIRSRVRQPVSVVMTDGSVQRLAALFARSGVVVSNDSGPRHLAIAAGARSLAFFRRHHDREWNVYPESPACRILRGEEECVSCPRGICSDSIPGGERFGSHCMRMITVDQAVRAVLAVLSSA